MQTHFSKAYLATQDGERANAILRSCVHCGLCNATCPTYQVLGDELDGPRGRIYLMKGLLEEADGGASGEALSVAQTHLDRCLTCRACETACPSGVAYGELLEIGRAAVERRARRRLLDRLMRLWLGLVVPSVRWFPRWAALGRWFRWALPKVLAAVLPERNQEAEGPLPVSQPIGERVLLLQGCVQRQATPATQAAAIRYFNDRGLQAVVAEGEGCCGGLNLHLGQTRQALDAMRRNLDALQPHLDGVQWIVSTASGCGVTVKDYGRLLADDPKYAALAATMAAKSRDLAEVAQALPAPKEDAPPSRPGRKVAWHPPCTLQHGQRLTGIVERLLAEAGHELVPVKDPHLCCGSAGTYSVLQPELSGRLRQDKLTNLTAGNPDVIATANVGCQMHLASPACPVVHWIELLAS
ncbi:MAG: glycolate oxidase subunit GlcF [Gammaproteobacteria bacterium]|nr:glycolate oxidase subunit GlcF [Gammaproteobacteria bacterium]MYE85775.1 glycolate oxidase subunit GlcF [Gammaproteobacteria bacterium]